MQRASQPAPPPPSLPRWSAGFCTTGLSDPIPPPPGLSRWNAGFCTTETLRSKHRPRRACLGGARASALRSENEQSIKPPLHRGKLGGGGVRGEVGGSAEARAPP